MRLVISSKCTQVCSAERKQSSKYEVAVNITTVNFRIILAKKMIGLGLKKHVLEGLFIMTAFQMSEDVIKLRLCGSYVRKDFLEAFLSAESCIFLSQVSALGACTRMLLC